MRKFLITLLISALSLPAYSQDCVSIDSFKEVLACSIKNAPNAQISNAEIQRSRMLEEQAAQRPNLQLSGSTVSSIKGFTQKNGSLSLTHTFELGNKRDARINAAQGEAHLAENSYFVDQTDILITTLVDLAKLENLKFELSILKENRRSLKKIIANYKARAVLNPEQKNSLNIFVLALEELKFQKSEIEVSIELLLSSLSLRAGGEIKSTASLSLPKLETWPQPDTFELKKINSPNIEKLKSAIDLQMANIKLEKANAWPDLQIGPAYEWSTSPSAENTDSSLGVQFTFSLPLWNRNQGGIALSQKAFNKSKVEMKVEKERSVVEKKAWLMKYEKGLDLLKNSTNPSQALIHHNYLIKNFAKGLIPSSLVLESNRQLFSYIQSHNNKKMMVLESLWNLEKLEGSLDRYLK